MKLLLPMAIVLASLLYVPATDAAVPYNTDYCDAMFSALWFQEVPPSIQSECGPRFQWNVNRIKRSFINSSKK